MNHKISSLALIVALAALFFVLLHPLSPPSSAKETAYERVARTMTLRCGYMLLPPAIEVDPNTKALKGMNYEYIEAVAKVLGLKLTWQEVILGQQIEALRTNKVDAICAGEGSLITTASLYLQYSEPLAYFPMHMYVRPGDNRFDGSLEQAIEKANNPGLTVAFVDADTTQDLAANLFPKTKRDELPQTVDYPQLYMEVADGKADFVVADPYTAGDFMKNNPGKLRQVKLDAPFAVIPNQISVLRGEDTLTDLLSQGIRLMRQRRLEDPILTKCERDYPGLYRVQTPYKVPAL